MTTGERRLQIFLKKKKKERATTNLDHHSIVRPWQSATLTVVASTIPTIGRDVGYFRSNDPMVDTKEREMSKLHLKGTLNHSENTTSVNDAEEDRWSSKHYEGWNATCDDQTL